MSALCDLIIAVLYYLFFVGACWRLYEAVGGFENKTSVRLALVWPVSLPLLAIVAAGQILYDLKKKEN